MQIHTKIMNKKGNDFSSNTSEPSILICSIEKICNRKHEINIDAGRSSLIKDRPKYISPSVSFDDKKEIQ